MYYLIENGEVKKRLVKHTDEDIQRLSNLNIYSIDTETAGLDPFNDRLLTVQIGNSEMQYVIPVNRNTKSLLKRVLGLTYNKQSILHNASFDLKFLWSNGLDTGPVYDTMIAEQVLNMGLYDTKKGKFSLKELIKKYMYEEVSKEIRDTFHGKTYKRFRITQDQILYAAKDIEHLEEIQRMQLNRARQYGYVNDNDFYDIHTVFGLEMRLVKALTRIEYNGIYIDVNRLKQVEQQLNEHLKNIEKQLIEKFTEDKRFNEFIDRQLDLFSNEKKLSINLLSPQDRLRIVKKLFPNISTTNKDILYEKKEKDSTGIIVLLIEYSETVKAITAFTKALPAHINPKTGRIHTSFFQVLSANRIASRNPNLQNIPSKGKVGKLIRDCFVAPEGKKIVGGDYSGCELRIIAQLSKDPNWIKIFNEDRDLHGELCALTFDIPIDKVRDPFPMNPKIDYRTVQKTVNFGLAYGMGPQKLGNRIGVSTEKASEIIDKFFRISSRVKEFLDRLERFAQKNKYIVTPRPYLRRRFLPYNDQDFKQKSAVGRKGKNTPIQGGNGEIIKLAIVMIDDYIQKYDYPAMIINTIHDEIQTEVVEDKAEEWRQIMQDIMTRAGSIIIKDIPALVECKISDKWEK